MFILKNFPLSPSSNQLYSSVNGRLIKSQEGRRYAASIQSYALTKHHEIKKIKEELKPSDILKVDFYFVFRRSRIISKKNEYKKLDAHNRLKSAADGLADIIGIDDKQFITGICEKVICEEHEREQIIIHISKTHQRKLEDIL